MKKILIVFILALSAALTSCRKGDAGEVGPAGADNLNKQGTVSGTFYYSYYNDYTMTNDTLILPFTYEYYESELDNLYNAYIDPQSQQAVYHSYEFTRRSLKDNSDYIHINYNYGVPSGPIPSDFEIELSLSRILANNGVYGFHSFSYFDNATDLSTLTISNYNFNSSTGALTFDFEMVIDPNVIDLGYNNATSYQPKVVGRVNVILRKKLYGSVSPA